MAENLPPLPPPRFSRRKESCANVKRESVLQMYSVLGRNSSGTASSKLDRKHPRVETSCLRVASDGGERRPAFHWHDNS